MSSGVIIAAAGQGKRMGYGVNKQFILLNQKPILIHTIEKFQNLPWIKEIIIVANKDEVKAIEELVEKHMLNVTKVIPGGKERQDSIEQGLMYINSEWVMVHDGARPFIDRGKLEELYNIVKIKDAVVLGVPVKDTIKVLDNTGIISYTPDRKSLWTIQTPQAFRLSILKEAYRNAKEKHFLGTDDSSLVEKIGVKTHLLEGSYNNIKITTKEDLVFAQMILDRWSEDND